MRCRTSRLHVKATVPPGDSLVGILPHDIIRLEQAKLTANEHLFLLTANYRSVPFDGGVHDLRARCGGTTLALGNHVSLFVRNASAEPQPLEVQIVGTSVVEDQEPEATLGVPAPLLSHKLVLGLFAQEVQALDEFTEEALAVTEGTG